MSQFLTTFLISFSPRLLGTSRRVCRTNFLWFLPCVTCFISRQSAPRNNNNNNNRLNIFIDVLVSVSGGAALVCNMAVICIVAIWLPYPLSKWARGKAAIGQPIGRRVVAHNSNQFKHPGTQFQIVPLPKTFKLILLLWATKRPPSWLGTWSS